MYGGANARPITTFHNTLDEKLYLRISLELYLKKLIIGGINKVFELAKNFRNEGMDKDHNPEFTMLEFYCAYADVYDMLAFTESMVKKVFKNVNNSRDVNFGKHNISLKNKFDLDIGYEKANSEVLELSGQYRFDYIKQDNFHSFMIIITALSMPFMKRSPIDLPPILSVDLIQITDTTSIPFAAKAAKTLEEIKKKEEERIVS